MTPERWEELNACLTKVLASEENRRSFEEIERKWKRGFYTVQDIENVLWSYFSDDRDGVDADVMANLPDVIGYLWNAIVRSHL